MVYCYTDRGLRSKGWFIVFIDEKGFGTVRAQSRWYMCADGILPKPWTELLLTFNTYIYGNNKSY